MFLKMSATIFIIATNCQDGENLECTQVASATVHKKFPEMYKKFTEIYDV